MADNGPYIDCEITKSSQHLVNVYYNRFGVVESEIDYGDVFFFCCFAIRQLANLRHLGHKCGSILATALSHAALDELESLNEVGIIYSSGHPINKGSRIVSRLHLGVGPRFECQATGFGFFRGLGEEKVYFAATATAALLYNLTVLSEGDKKRLCRASKACASCYELGFHPIAGELTINNQWAIACAITDEVCGDLEAQANSEPSAFFEKEPMKSKTLPYSELRETEERRYYTPSSREDAQEIRKQAADAEKARLELLKKLRENKKEK